MTINTDVAIRIPRGIRFIAVGLFCTALQQLLLVLFVEGGSQEHLANTAGFIISAQANFLLSYHITYGDRKGDIITRLWQFNALAIAVLLGNIAIFTIALRYIPYFVAGFLGIGGGAVIGAAVNYAVGTKFIFKPAFQIESKTTRTPVSREA